MAQLPGLTSTPRLPEAGLMTLWKQCKKKEYRIPAPLFFISNPDCKPQLYDPLDSLWREAQYLRQQPTVFSTLPA